LELSQQQLERTIMYTDQAMKDGTFLFSNMNMPIEQRMHDQYRKTLELSSRKAPPPNEPRSKDEEREEFRGVGAENIRRIEQQFGPDKEKIRRTPGGE